MDDSDRSSLKPRYVIFCVGLSHDHVNELREAYMPNVSACGALLSPSNEYDVKIVGFHTRKLDTVFNNLRFKPNLLILGPDLQAPYPAFVKDWITWAHPSVMRIAERRIEIQQLSHEDYYLRTFSVLPFSQTNDRMKVAEEIDYGILVNLNWRREVKIEDFDHHMIKLEDVGSTADLDEEDSEERNDAIRTAREIGSSLRPDLNFSYTAMAAVSSFFGVLAHSGTR
jgi:hypothetical protein